MAQKKKSEEAEVLDTDDTGGGTSANQVFDSTFSASVDAQQTQLFNGLAQIRKARVNQLTREAASKLISAASEFFRLDGVSCTNELARLDRQRDAILSTDYVKQTEPNLLPWRHPMAKAVHDLIKGHGWTGGFRSKSVFCLDARRK